MTGRFHNRDEDIIARIAAVSLSRPVQVVLAIVRLTLSIRQTALLGNGTTRNQLTSLASMCPVGQFRLPCPGFESEGCVRTRQH